MGVADRPRHTGRRPRRRVPGARLADLVRDLEERAAQHAPTVQGVTLASFHAAKGLEWDTVFLVGCSDGLIPITMAEGPPAIEEERRLLYVGVTRAREHLMLSWAVARTPGARATRRPSRFLDGRRRARRRRPLPSTNAAARAAPVARERRRPRRAPPAAPAGPALGTATERTIGRC